MRKLCVLALVAGLLWGGSIPTANAAPIINLTFQSTGLTTATLSPGQSVVMNVILINDVNLIAATFMVRTDNGVIAITDATSTPTPFSSMSFGFSAGEAGHFGGLSAVPVGPGTYDLGDITFTAGANQGITTILPFQRDGIDDWFGSADLNDIVLPILNTATINVIPEPSTVSLLGLGFAILVASRRKVR